MHTFLHPLRMSLLSDADRMFVERRRSRRSVGLYVLPVALVVLVLAWGTMFVLWPLSVNPFTVVGHIESRVFEPGTLTMYAVTAVVLMNVVFALLAAVLVLAIVWARHERRYLKLLNNPEPSPKPL